ncbi:hypothetical protein H7J08_00985 [Mycobacterium frederiksbergense]|uniref:hypothetical protein n=1 Tax=Mycolicibacterium frederiksbergense TaxID=117567 RepID=UPI0021F347F3|nr:hypothetical protein [Mycolicibacterium frederiksbergense]MCV7043252.1 hypothetical protein [Mycolicibacterium frederiksbergense]
MSRYRNATGVNIHAGQGISEQLIAQLSSTYRDALTPLHSLGQRESVAPAEAVAALHTLTAAAAGLRQLRFEILGAAVLAGRPVADVADATGISPSTLTRRLKHTSARLRGREMVFEPAAPHGWATL